jgi:ADP-ribose pyrophosphatase YjhB (NUDIX family)
MSSSLGSASDLQEAMARETSTHAAPRARAHDCLVNGPWYCVCTQMSPRRTDRLSSYLAHSNTFLAEEFVSWLDGRVRLRLRTYLTNVMPPPEYSTSSRCVVLRHDSVLVQRDRDSTHILPGGRCEADESPLETVRREVLEETGWAIGEPLLLGFVHFNHLSPKPSGYTYPYPDFVQVVYMANAVTFVPEAKLDDSYEVESVFRSIDELSCLALPLPLGQQLFLEAALQLRSRVGVAEQIQM